ncbi:helix-hairpin-helix domain-containing protein [Natronomonas sp. LN261]|uniref:helix-hairpin-helix domain-containing protein n=1 Tax=Natronomonas sp. LN261 TaxID=2750669 RepID=UPI0015EF902B|nr:helix-hairpin-helix domain-containing protein [Natronomonas sp. LN261]
MEFEGLESIPGVGAKTADRLAELDDPVGAVSEGDVARIARAPGISEGRAARIARASIRQRHGDSGTFLATDRAEELYESILGLLQERAVTSYGRKRLETLYPSASASRIEEVRSFAKDAVEREPTPELLEALSDVEPLESPEVVRVRDRCLATSNAETYAEATDEMPELSVELVDDTRDVSDLARGYSTVVVLDEAFAGIELEGDADVRVEPDALSEPAAVVPERTLSFFARNRGRLLAAAAVHRTVSAGGNTEGPRNDTAAPVDDTGTPASDIKGSASDTKGSAGDGLLGSDHGTSLDVEALERALERLTEEGGVDDDERLCALETAIDDLDAAVSMAEGVANDRLRAAIEERDVTIEGADLLSLVERGAGVDSLLKRELSEEFAEAIEAARERLVDAVGVDDYESLARGAFPEEPTFPVEHDERVIDRLREELSADRDRRATRLKREMAEELDGLRRPAEALVDAALELDVELAVSRFAREFDCTFPTFEGSGVVIEGGRSPILDIGFEDVEPVDYGIEGVSLLSGVNSGGKTSTLDLVGTVVIAAQMGLPVPADSVRTRRFEALHYQAKTQGTLDAGAFESTLREFGSLVEGAEGRLVLVDELESITEPGASAVIVAGILEAMAESDSTAVFVSHLAREILDATDADADVSVDGIEAVGLVDGELQVNRSPVKDHLARSTPELIVEKLADEGENDGEFYSALLEKFEEDSG